LYADSSNTLYPLSMVLFSGFGTLFDKTFRLVLGSSNLQRIMSQQDAGNGLNIDFNVIVGNIRTLQGPVLTHHQFVELLGKVIENNSNCQGIMWNIFDSLGSSATKVPLSQFVICCAILCEFPGIPKKFSLLIDLFAEKSAAPNIEEVKKIISCIEDCAGPLLNTEPKAANKPYV